MAKVTATHAAFNAPNTTKVIAVLNSGFVFIGERLRCGTGDVPTLFLTNASNIRTWGTTHGLGEIALSGPTKNTILDPVGDMEAPMSSVICLIACKV